MNLLEYEIDGQIYGFKASFDFLHEVNKKILKDVDFDQKKQVGLIWLVANMVDGDIDALVDCLFALNIGHSPRVTKTKLQKWLEDFEDIDSVFNEVLDFLFNANVCKKSLKEIKKLHEEQKEAEKK